MATTKSKAGKVISKVTTKIKQAVAPKVSKPKVSTMGQTKKPSPIKNLSGLSLSSIKAPTSIGGGVVAKNNTLYKGGKAVGSTQMPDTTPTLKGNVTYGGGYMWQDGKAIGSSEKNKNLPGYGGSTNTDYNLNKNNNKVTFGANNTMYRNGEAVGSYQDGSPELPSAPLKMGASAQSQAKGTTYGGTKPLTVGGNYIQRDTATVADYSQKDNETLKKLEEEANKLKEPSREDMNRDIARQYRDQLDFIRQAKAIAIKQAEKANLEKSNTQRAIQAAAGNLGTEFGAGVQQKVNESNTEDITKAQLPYVEQEVALQREIMDKQQSRFKDSVIQSAISKGLSSPTAIANYAAENGIELSLDEIQGFGKMGGSGGESGALSFSDAMKAGVPYGTTYEQLYGQTVSGAGNKPLSGDAAKVLSIATSVIPEVEQLKAAMNKNYRKTILGIKTGTDTTLVRLFESVADKVGRLRSGGAINTDEAESFKGQIARVMDLYKNDPRASINALNAIIAEANQVASSMQGQQSGSYNTSSSFNNIDLNTIDSAIDALL